MYTHIERSTRQKWLEDHYRFQCLCIACESDYPLRKNLSGNPWRCPDCHLRLSPKGLCEKCQKTPDIELLKERLEHFRGKLEEVKTNVNNLEEGDASGYKRQFLALSEIVAEISDLVAPDCEAFLSARDFYTSMIAKVFGNSGNHA